MCILASQKSQKYPKSQKVIPINMGLLLRHSKEMYVTIMSPFILDSLRKEEKILLCNILKEYNVQNSIMG